MFECKTVVVRKIADSLAAGAIRMDSSLTVDIDKAKQQHEAYQQVFRDLGLRVIVLDEDESLPDCVFVEDPAVVVGKKALVTNPGHASRRPECKLMRECLEKIGLEVSVMNEIDPSAMMDGGDMLFTGEEIFIGLSNRTDKAGHEVLRQVFQPIPVHSVQVVGDLHLKSVTSLCSPGKILVFTGNAGAKETIENMKSAAQVKYEYIDVPGSAKFANCVYLERDGKGAVLHCPESRETFKNLDIHTKIEVDLSELRKVDGCLTCSSLLVGL